jgi:uncharacterized membrane protein
MFQNTTVLPCVSVSLWLRQKMEEIAKHITINVSHAVEILAGIIIGIAVVRAAFQYIMSFPISKVGLNTPFFRRGWGRPEAIRVQFGSSVAVSLELLLGADVLATAVAPSWDAIGKLAAIAVIRTLINYFLERELKQMHVKM